MSQQECGGAQPAGETAQASLPAAPDHQKRPEGGVRPAEPNLTVYPEGPRREGSGWVAGQTPACSSPSQRQQVRRRASAGPHPEGTFPIVDSKQRLPAVRQFPAAPAAPKPDVKLRGAALAAAIFSSGKTPSSRPPAPPPTPKSPGFSVTKAAQFILEAVQKKHTKDPTVHDNGSAQARPM